MKSLLVVLFLWSLAISQMLKTADEVTPVSLTSQEISKNLELQNSASQPQFLLNLGLETRYELSKVILASLNL